MFTTDMLKSLQDTLDNTNKRLVKTNNPIADIAAKEAVEWIKENCPEVWDIYVKELLLNSIRDSLNHKTYGIVYDKAKNS